LCPSATLSGFPPPLLPSRGVSPESPRKVRGIYRCLFNPFRRLSPGFVRPLLFPFIGCQSNLFCTPFVYTVWNQHSFSLLFSHRAKFTSIASFLPASSRPHRSAPFFRGAISNFIPNLQSFLCELLSFEPSSSLEFRKGRPPWVSPVFSSFFIPPLPILCNAGLLQFTVSPPFIGEISSSFFKIFPGRRLHRF